MKQQFDMVLNSLDIKGTCVNAERHGHLAFYDVQLEPGQTVGKLERRTREIALALRSKTTPIVKLLPEHGLVRLRVAVSDSNITHLNNLFESTVFPKSYGLPFLLGKTDEGKTLWVDFSKHPHTLIAGGTGSGKSVLLHALIANAAVLHANKLRNIEIYLSDPKKVEFNIYENNIPGLIKSVVYDYTGTVSMLEFISMHMEARYNAMAKLGFQNITECPNIFPYVLVIIDEVADLMMMDKRSHIFENEIIRLAQKARAAGIHLVLATQRPSRDILTGTIKANFPARIACRVSSRVDSSVILDTIGAENLLGCGDAIIRNHNLDNERFQVALSNPRDTVRVFNLL